MRTAIAATLLCLSPTFAFAQARDRPAPLVSVVKPGAALVAGRVSSSADTDTPVHRAVVSLISADGTDRRSTVTDGEGRFTFRALPAGRYALTAEKASYLTTNYGARRPGRPGTALLITEGQQLPDLRMWLPKGAVIGGAVKTAAGEPLPNTQVMAIPIALATAGGQAPRETVTFLTDDLGQYRIYGLTPGDYLLAALPQVGRGDVESRSDADYDAIERALSQRTIPGAPPATATPMPPPVVSGYAPTYYPGTPVSTQAVPIRVAVGDEKLGVDVPVTMFPMATIRGTVIGIDGAPKQAVQVTADPVGPPLPLSAALAIRSGRPDAEGRFTISGVPPGSYTINVRGGGIVLSNSGLAQSVNTDRQTEWASASVQISGENVEGLTLTLQPGLTLSGSLVSTKAGTTPHVWTGARVTVQRVNTTGNTVTMVNGSAIGGTATRTATVAADGSFEVSGLQPGNYELLVRLPTTMSTWSVQSIVHDGRDLRDAPLTFAQGSLSGVTVTVSEQPTIVTGTLSISTGAVASDYYIVVFPTDRSVWHPGSPRVKLTRPGVDGVFTLRDLPAGEYRISALTDVEEDETRSATFLEQLMDQSLVLVVTGGATTRQDIRIAK